jgi:hypothetical protein
MTSGITPLFFENFQKPGTRNYFNFGKLSKKNLELKDFENFENSRSIGYKKNPRTVHQWCLCL